MLLSTTTVYLIHRSADRFGDRQHVLQIRGPVLALRRSDSDEDDRRGSNRGGKVGGEAETLLLLISDDHFLETGLVDRHLAAPQRLNLRLVLIDARNSVSIFSQACTEHEPDVSRTDDSNFHFAIRYWLETT